MDLETELAKTEFDGKINWEPNKQWAKIPVQVAETEENYFYKNGGRIYVQPKNGPIEERTPRCYGCNTPAKIVLLAVQNYEPGSVIGDGSVNNEFSFYCETCDGKPPPNMIGGVRYIEMKPEHSRT